MTVRFDPKANTNPPVVQNQEAKGLAAPIEEPDANAQETITEMDLLFSGVRKIEAYREQRPTTNVPDFERDILKPLPAIGSASPSVWGVIHHYQVLRKNLTERRSSYSHALEGYLKPEEAFDLIDRIDEINRALVLIEKNLAKADQRESQLKVIEERKRKALEEG